MKTNLDLHTSASAAALASLNVTSDFVMDTTMMETFTVQQQHPADWEAWKGIFNERRGHFKLLSTQPAPSVAAITADARAARLSAPAEPPAPAELATSAALS